MSKFLHDNLGNESSMRAMFAIIPGAVFIVWAIVSLVKTELVEIPPMVAAIVMAIITAKVWQKHVELNAPEGK